jgi:hypothetical protein
MMSSNLFGSVFVLGLMMGFVALPTFKEQSSKIEPVKVSAVAAAVLEANSTNAKRAGG